MADRAIEWIGQQKAAAPDKPFFMYWAPGAGHAPHHVAPEWADRYKGKFDHGWDEQRKRTVENQKRLGIIPADTRLTPRPDSIPAWEACSPDEKRLYARMQEVYAGFVEHVDVQIGRLRRHGGRVSRRVGRALHEPGAASRAREPRLGGVPHALPAVRERPITFFSFESAWREPEWMRSPRGPDVSPDPRWFPVVTMLQLAADMALGSAPPGFGHEFAPADYIDAWVALTEPEGAGPRPTSNACAACSGRRRRRTDVAPRRSLQNTTFARTAPVTVVLDAPLGARLDERSAPGCPPRPAGEESWPTCGRPSCRS